MTNFSETNLLHVTSNFTNYREYMTIIRDKKVQRAFLDNCGSDGSISHSEYNQVLYYLLMRISFRNGALLETVSQGLKTNINKYIDETGEKYRLKLVIFRWTNDINSFFEESWKSKTKIQAGPRMSWLINLTKSFWKNTKNYVKQWPVHGMRKIQITCLWTIVWNQSRSTFQGKSKNFRLRHANT